MMRLCGEIFFTGTMHVFGFLCVGGSLSCGLLRPFFLVCAAMGARVFL